MKKLIISLCLMGMVVVPTQVKATQNSEVCVAVVDEDGNVLNQEEYLVDAGRTWIRCGNV